MPAPIEPAQLHPWARASALKRLTNRSPETNWIGMRELPRVVGGLCPRDCRFAKSVETASRGRQRRQRYAVANTSGRAERLLPLRRFLRQCPHRLLQLILSDAHAVFPLPEPR